MTPTVDRSSSIIMLVVTLVMTGTGMMFPLLSIAAESLGGGPAEAGLFLGAFAAARLCLNFPAGFASDRFGRKRVMSVGMSVLAAGALLAWSAQRIPTMAGAVFLLGAGTSIAATAALAATADRASPSTRGVVMSRYQTAVLVGIALGPAIGGVVSARLGLFAPFLLHAILAGLGLALLLAGLEAGTGRAAIPRAGAGAGVAAVVSWRSLLTAALLTVGLVNFVMFMTRTAANWQLAPLIARERFGYGPDAVGLLLTVGALTNLFMLSFIGRCIDRIGAPRALILGAAGVVCGLLLMSAPSSPPLLWTAVVLLGASSGVMAPSVSSLAIELAPTGHGVTLGALRTTGDAGLVLGPVLIGHFVATSGESLGAVLWTCAGVVACAAATFIVAHWRSLSGAP